MKTYVFGLSMGGYGEPGAKITRADLLMLLVKTLDLRADADFNFSDVNKSAYYYQTLGIAKKLDISQGEGDGKFNPDSPVSRQDMTTREEAAVILYRIYNK